MRALESDDVAAERLELLLVLAQLAVRVEVAGCELRQLVERVAGILERALIRQAEAEALEIEYEALHLYSPYQPSLGCHVMPRLG